MFIDVEVVQDAMSSNDQDFSIALRSPLEALFLAHKNEKQSISGIAEFLGDKTNGALSYFFSAASVHDRWADTLKLDRLFDAAQATKALDASYWQRAIQLTDVLDIMPAQKRNEWNESIRTHDTPAFEREAVLDTLQELLLKREQFFCERVDGVFRNLSGEHVTNAPEGFSKRMIMNYFFSAWGHLDYERVSYIHDLRFVIATFMGREQPCSRLTNSMIDTIHKQERFGKWHDFDGGAFRFKLYKKGTAHIEIHPDIAWRLNSLLAKLHPMAIPTRFHKRPAKAKKFDLCMDLLSEQTIVELNCLKRDVRGHTLTFPYSSIAALTPTKKAREEAEKVLEGLGGVKLPGTSSWSFDFDVTDVLKEVVRMGHLPGQSFQYYATPAELAEIVVDLAAISETDDVLEPSAGQGNLAQFVPCSRLTCIEISSLHCTVLKAKGFNVIEGDFLELPASRVSKIVMNPPFSGNRAQLHVRHAAEHWLKPGGRLVAVLPASLDNHTLLKGYRHTYSQVYTNYFKGTGVSVVILTLDSPLS